MKIIFSCTGFGSTEAFVIKDGRQLNCGTLMWKFPDTPPEYWPSDYFVEHYVKRQGYVTMEDVPTAEQVIEAYNKAEAEHGVWINNEIVYAG
jgi:hypothetical protein